ncbi:MAG: DUF3619 family protein [Rhodocyclales bacterium]|nr:DUF3619 family protein [Rhodocyclales bacterium]
MNKTTDEADLAARIRGMLDQGTAEISQKASLRLYEARCDALRHQGAAVAALSLAGIGHTLGSSFHRHYRGILALVALAVGAMGVQVWQNEQEAAALAEIDSELLGDEVPPSAYTDQGFLEWLQQISESDEESLPE